MHRSNTFGYVESIILIKDLLNSSTVSDDNGLGLKLFSSGYVPGEYHNIAPHTDSGQLRYLSDILLMWVLTSINFLLPLS